MEFKYRGNQEQVNITLTKEQAEVIKNYLFDRMIKLEECKLEDSYCYLKISEAYYKLLLCLRDKPATEQVIMVVE